MKQFYFKQMLAAILLLCGTVAMAQDFTVDGIEYDVLSETERTVAVSGPLGLTELVIPETVTNNDTTSTTYTVTEIAKNAFSARRSTQATLTKVIIGKNVRVIGTQAFQNQTKITGLTLGENVETIDGRAFYSCKGIKELTIGNNVKSIGSDAFTLCSGITKLTIGNSVKTIAPGAFRACSGITELTIGENVDSISSDAFYGCNNLEFVYNNSSLDVSNFAGISSAKYIVNKGENLVGDYIFRTINDTITLTKYLGEDSALTLPTYYNGAQYAIGNGVFAKDYTITSVVIPEGAISIGDSVFFNCKRLTNITIPNGIISIGNNAFDGCTGLTSVTIPNGVTSIGNSAFNGCTGLTNITIPGSVTHIGQGTFANCTSLTNATISEGVTAISEDMFFYCRSLDSVNIASSVMSIGKRAFYGCNLASISIPKNVITIEDHAFTRNNATNITVEEGNKTYDSRNGCNAIVETANNTLVTGCKNTIIPNDITTIGDSCFAYCSELTQMTIPNSVTNIEKGAFAYCSKLANISGGESVAHMGSGAFFGCHELTGITIPDGVPSIGDQTFWGCFALTNVSIPNSVTSIGNGAFMYCTHLTNMTIPDNVTSIGENAFRECSGLKSITIGNSVTNIGEFAFIGCLGLTSITIPASVTKIGENAFSTYSLTSIIVEEGNKVYDSREGCNAIIETASNTLILGCKNTVIPYSVTKIQNNAFARCEGLTSITFPASIETIEKYAFSNCTDLTDVYSEIAAKDLSDKNAFYCSGVNYDSITLHIPYGTKNAYATTEGWKEFTNVVEELTMAASLPALYNEVMTYANSVAEDTTFTDHGLIKSADQLYTNEQEETEGPIANLIDGDTDTFFHSTWSTEDDGEYHYLQIDLGEPLDAVAIKYSKRSDDGNHIKDCSPVKVRVFANNAPEEEWNETGVHHLTYDYSVDSVATGCHTIVLNNSYRYIRLQVESTVDNYYFHTDNVYFSLSEFGVWPSRFEEEHAAYSDVPSGLMEELKSALSDAKNELTTGNYTYATVNRLHTAFERVKNYDPTNIEGTCIDSNPDASAIYYDLHGRKVEHPTQGIYIKNGKKIFIK